jgi:hypothetical protein
VNPNFGRPRLRHILALGSLIATTCFAGTPLATVSACAARASPALSGIKDLSEACPELPAALNTLGLDKTLYAGWQDKLSVHALQDAVLLGERYSDARWRRGPPATAGVPAIVQSLKDEHAPPAVSWWRSFKNWIKHWLDHSDSAVAKWLKHLLDGVWGTAHVSTGVLQAFVYMVTALAALAAIFIVVRELKIAGIAARIKRARTPKGPMDDPLGQSLTPETSNLDENTPAGLLRMLVKRLLQMGRLTTERSLTHRELIARADFHDDGQRSVFARVARSAESLLYGSQPPRPDDLEAVTKQGRELLQQLSATERVI